MHSIKYIFIVSLLIMTGCQVEEVKIVQKDHHTTTEVGTIKNQKLITKEKKEIVEPTPKKDLLQKIEPPSPSLSVAQKKEYFYTILLPVVTEVYHTLQKQYEMVQQDIQKKRNLQFIEKLKKEYKATTNQELLQALKPHPISITLAQAAIESAWLSSRFAVEANNIFGVWSFNTKEPRIEASGSRGEKKIYLKKYKNLKSAVFDYYKNLGRSWAFATFREQRVLTNDPYVLVEHLGHFSEKREIYTDTLKKMIEYNNLEKYDTK